MIAASAPGKVVLSGEYAVLDGAPAISVAIDRRASARVDGFDGQWHRVMAPGFAEIEGRFVMRDGVLEWLQGASEFELVDAVVRVVDALPAAGLSIELDTRAFVDADSGAKIGIGSSAALTVALLAALRNSDDVYNDALTAHRRLQRGAGSGVDIASAVHGGLIEFAGDTRNVTELAWPTGLACRFVWTGVAVSTREKLAKLAATEHRESRQQLGRAAATMAAAWRSTDAVLNEYPAYIDALRQFDVDHDLGIFDAGHDELAVRAASAGLVYKPCGAGGGDIGALLGRSEQELDEFMAGGEKVLRCAVEPRGVEQH